MHIKTFIGYDMIYDVKENKIILKPWESTLPVEHKGKIYPVPIRKLNKIMQKYALNKFKNS